MNRKAGNNANNTVRIIGGRWRRRKLEFPPIEGLRPTPDRVRETVFNWLQAELSRARVLDAYCGSGVLGLESLSRGAADATFVDSSSQVCRQLKQHLDTLEAENAAVHQQAFLRWIEHAAKQSSRFDIVFIDPPYDSRLQQPSIEALLASKLLAANGLLYTEFQIGSEPSLPDQLSITKTLTAGNNRYLLAQLLPESHNQSCA
ncbi:MAG: 16S rRNA (guanine(966)-N(2))-methyltransferase RsmD [Pseudomonadales bacterium]